MLYEMEQTGNLTEGISYLKNGKIIHNKFHLLLKDLDSLPFPARHHIADRDYHESQIEDTRLIRQQSLHETALISAFTAYRVR